VERDQRNGRQGSERLLKGQEGSVEGWEQVTKGREVHGQQ
jgi:hypothetical protein